MKCIELDRLDVAIARLEGPSVATVDSHGQAIRPDHTRYRPTRCPDDLVYLIEKHITKVLRMNNGDWAAVGESGRACTGSTLPIAVCRAVLGLC